jgi:CheY-like chemotaxis protein
MHTQKDYKYSVLNPQLDLDHPMGYIETEQKTVMICEDEPDLLKLFGLALKSKYNVILVSSGEECIKRFIEELKRGNKIHLLLLDYRFSDISGESVARKIKEHNNTKIIMITAYSLDDSLLKELEESNCVAKFIKKPVQLKSLINLVADTINQN